MTPLLIRIEPVPGGYDWTVRLPTPGHVHEVIGFSARRKDALDAACDVARTRILLAEMDADADHYIR